MLDLLHLLLLRASITVLTLKVSVSPISVDCLFLMTLVPLDMPNWRVIENKHSTDVESPVASARGTMLIRWPRGRCSTTNRVRVSERSLTLKMSRAPISARVLVLGDPPHRRPGIERQRKRKTSLLNRRRWPARSGWGLADIAHHVIECHFTHGMSFQTRTEDSRCVATT
jgi:hypothetical protein